MNFLSWLRHTLSDRHRYKTVKKKSHLKSNKWFWGKNSKNQNKLYTKDDVEQISRHIYWCYTLGYSTEMKPDTRKNGVSGLCVSPTIYGRLSASGRSHSLMMCEIYSFFFKYWHTIETDRKRVSSLFGDIIFKWKDICCVAMKKITTANYTPPRELISCWCRSVRRLYTNYIVSFIFLTSTRRVTNRLSLISTVTLGRNNKTQRSRIKGQVANSSSSVVLKLEATFK